MDKRTREIYKAFKGKVMGNWLMKRMVCKTVALLPEKTAKLVTQSCWFLSSMDDAWAYTFTGNDLKGQHLIFLSDDLLREKPEQIMHSVAHEIGHVVLRHRNSITVNQTKKEVQKQEKEAEAFASELF